MLGLLRCGARLTATLTVLLAARAALARSEPEPGAKERAGQQWSRALARAMGLCVRVRGRLPELPALLVANHRSYADIPALWSVAPCTFLAKAEVGGWPLVGALARELGTVFVDRSCTESRRSARSRLGSLLAAGHRVAVFPEGTTSRGPGLLPFQPGMFREAARLGIAVVPIAVGYASPADAWVEDDTLLRHFSERFAQRRVGVEISIGPAIASCDAGTLLRHSETWIDRELRIHPPLPDSNERREGIDDGQPERPHRLSLQTGKVAV